MSTIVTASALRMAKASSFDRFGAACSASWMPFSISRRCSALCHSAVLDLSALWGCDEMSEQRTREESEQLTACRLGSESSWAPSRRNPVEYSIEPAAREREAGLRTALGRRPEASPEVIERRQLSPRTPRRAITCRPILHGLQDFCQRYPVQQKALETLVSSHYGTLREKRYQITGGHTLCR